MKKPLLILAILLIGAFVLSACGAAETEVPTEPAAEEPTEEAAPSPMDTIIEEAKKEGQLIVYSSYNVEQGQTIHNAFMEKYPFITAIVRGDGEAAALQISRSLAQGRSFLSDQTPNLAWLDEGEIRATPIQPMTLDDLPIFDFRPLRNPCCYQIIDLMTSRGCPFRCSYCLENTMRPYAAHPPDWSYRHT